MDAQQICIHSSQTIWKLENLLTNLRIPMHAYCICARIAWLIHPWLNPSSSIFFSFPRFLMDSGGSRRNGRSFGLGWPRARESVHLDKCPRDTIDRYARRLRFMRYSALTVYYSWSAFDNEKHRTVYFRVDNRARYNINCSPLFFLTPDKK